MSFSDNLENNLKSLEAQEERDPQAIQRERERAEQERRDKQAAAPFARQLREGAFTQGLLEHATRLGFSKRAKVHIAWLDTTLRLEARNLRLELKPTGNGVRGHFFVDGAETDQRAIDLGSDPSELAKLWLSPL